MNVTPEHDPTSSRGDIVCGLCRGTQLDFRWQRFSNGARHIRVNCGRCGAYVRYAPQTAENIARADAAASMERAS